MKILDTKSAESRKSIVEISGNSRKKYSDKVGLDSKNEVSGDKVNSDKIKNNDVLKEKNYQKTSKSKKLFKSKKTIRFLDFLTSRARLVFIKFIKLRQVFVKVSILYHLCNVVITGPVDHGLHVI